MISNMIIHLHKILGHEFSDDKIPTRQLYTNRLFFNINKKLCYTFDKKEQEI